MTTVKRPAPKRRQRAHDVLPAGFAWRDGRPRWIPSPTRRRQGWKAIDLRDGMGRFLAKGPAVSRAEEIAAAVKGWSEGKPVPSAFVAIAPKGSVLKGVTSADLAPRAIGTLLEAYYASPKFMSRAPRTQVDYRNKIRRLLEVVACPEPPLTRDGKRDKARIDAKVEALKRLDIDFFTPPAFDAAGESVLETAYDTLREQAGTSQAFGVLAAASAWFGWCVKKRRVWASNPAAGVERETPDGRIRVAGYDELEALVASANALGLASIADAVILAVDLSWSQQDLLALTWGQIAADGRVKHRRIKTGVAGNPPLLAAGRRRLELVRERWREARVRPTHVLVREATSLAWDEHAFRHAYADVRAHAAARCAAVADLQFRDLRDTAVTYGIEAGLTVEEICSRTLHEPARAQAVITKHYGAIRQEVADGAARKLDAHLASKGYKL